ncbi:hypothetical protein ABT074_03170, partial [Streptomyces sp. NPDC002205]
RLPVPTSSVAPRREPVNTPCVTCENANYPALGELQTGERSVDLTRIRDVRLLTGFSYGGTFRAVVVRDRNGVRIGLTTVRSQRALVRALQHACGDVQGGPCVSPAARAHLGLGVRRHRTIHTVIIFLLLTTSISLYLGLVLELAAFR